jgi:hypothetical protein
MGGDLGAVATGGHVARAAPPALAGAEEEQHADRVGATSDEAGVTVEDVEDGSRQIDSQLRGGGGGDELDAVRASRELDDAGVAGHDVVEAIEQLGIRICLEGRSEGIAEATDEPQCRHLVVAGAAGGERPLSLSTPRATVGDQVHTRCTARADRTSTRQDRLARRSCSRATDQDPIGRPRTGQTGLNALIRMRSQVRFLLAPTANYLVTALISQVGKQSGTAREQTREQRTPRRARSVAPGARSHGREANAASRRR